MKPTPDRIPRSIWALGIATFLINASSVIVFGLSAVYMKTILGVHTGLIGFLEGAVEACSYLTKLLSGMFSDYIRRRKAIMVFGFSLATIARPILAIYSTFFAVFVARILDRIGNGMQSTPRDALVGDISPPSIKGACYGLRQALAAGGSFVGGGIGYLAMTWTDSNFQYVFWIASIPAVLGLMVLAIAVKEPPKIPPTTPGIQKYRKISWRDLPLLGRRYWMLMGIAGIFMLARVSEAMLILHAHQNFGLDKNYIPFILILYNGSNSLASYPVGWLSDRMPREYLLGIGFLLLVLADLTLALAPSLWVMMIGVIIWGIQIGITQNMFLSLVADTVPEDLRGTGFGFFYLITACSLLISSSIGGTIAHYYGEAQMFIVSSIVGGIAVFALVAFGKSRARQHYS